MNVELKEALLRAGVDTEGALRRFAGNDALYERFLLKFLSDETYAQIAPSLEQGDYETAMRAAHTLKGVSANLGMNRLYEVCSHLVNDLRTGEPQAALGRLPAMEAAYQELCEPLRAQQKDGSR